MLSSDSNFEHKLSLGIEENDTTVHPTQDSLKGRCWVEDGRVIFREKDSSHSQGERLYVSHNAGHFVNIDLEKRFLN